MISPERSSILLFASILPFGALSLACGTPGGGGDGAAAPSPGTDGGAWADASSGAQPGTGDGSSGIDAATGAGDASPAPSLPDGGAPNVLPVTVNGSLCLAQQYLNVNEPCTRVTICQPGTTSCQTIDGILLDTGSTGLRLFRSVVTLSLPPVKTASGGTLAECESYSGGAADWGSIAQADLVLAGEPAVTLPVQLIDRTFSAPPGPGCDPAKGAQLDPDPQTAGFNGILGISHHATDCGAACQTSANNGTYYSCTATTCTGVASDVQLVNPIGLLPADGNGYVVTLPSVPAGGAPSVSGTVTFGIGTRSNNVPGGVTVFPTATFGTLFSDFSATPIQSGTLDTGSSKLYFPAIAQVPVCSSGDGGAPQTGALCPATPATLSATMISGASEETISFTVDNADALLASSNNVFPGYAAAVSASDPYFMWGLPFFFGRSVYVAIDAKATSLGTGPYWAY